MIKTNSYSEVQKRISLDFDGVFNKYKGWDDYLPIPEPRNGLIDFLEKLNEDYEIIINTARNTEDIMPWLKQHNLDEYIFNVSNVKYPANVYVDDRAISFKGNYNQTYKQIIHFKPYWED